ncbi:hypothetical protein BC941DRAFT_3515 [Chlamydoabsidia padenii]|nr:hypothetical protein BC941DRAFT_3515 [Chlamydoabsidia padenii]
MLINPRWSIMTIPISYYFFESCFFVSFQNKPKTKWNTTNRQKLFSWTQQRWKGSQLGYLVRGHSSTSPFPTVLGGSMTLGQPLHKRLFTTYG